MDSANANRRKAVVMCKTEEFQSPIWQEKIPVGSMGLLERQSMIAPAP
ncbi:hypothetical protein C4K03_3170 [Pseudomonas synxantha]|uniref:Uncharacterized protein n=1 Tax=Pseudomonas synxantha TaxID=47883 RepID=A0A3G7U7N0_9PSED|nr:hypothetical protein C4K03_3170 [Pseudomonas synxantha]